VSISEQALVFACAGEVLVGVATVPDEPRGDLAVLIVVGGPQYRVGSHRQFVHLARRLGAAGYPVLRFDYRGMGDAGGERRAFDAVDEDLRAAVDALMAAVPQVRRVVLWGLCDGASAALIYLPQDGRVAGVVAANPWVRDAQTQAVTQVKHYYAGRLASAAFWKKLAGGGVDLRRAVRKLGAALARSRAGGPADPAAARFQDRMLTGWRTAAGRILLLLSGVDLTAREFEEYAARRPEWRGALEPETAARAEFPTADHTFSTAQDKNAVADRVCAWLERLG